MTNSEKLKILKQAKKLFVEHPEYWGMCFCIEHAMAGTERGITIYDERDIVALFPEFNRKFLDAPRTETVKHFGGLQIVRKDTLLGLKHLIN